MVMAVVNQLNWKIFLNPWFQHFLELRDRLQRPDVHREHVPSCCGSGYKACLGNIMYVLFLPSDTPACSKSCPVGEVCRELNLKVFWLALKFYLKEKY